MVNKISLVALALLLSGCSVEDAAGPDVVNGELPESKYQAFLNGQEENGEDDNFPANGQFPSEWLTLQGSASAWQVAQDRTFAGDYALKSGSVGNGQYSAMVLTDTFEAGTFSFFYYISSEFEQDGLIVQVDGESVLVDSGVKSQWFEFTMELDAGQHEILFAYTKNNSNVDGEDAAWIDNLNLPERSTSNGSADVFPEGGDVFPSGWSMASGVNANWQVSDARSYQGSYSLASANISANQSSGVSYQGNFEAGIFSFYYFTSSELNLDELRVYMDQQLLAEYSGQSSDWEFASFSVPQGEHEFRFVYSKDGSVNTGDDKVWIDNVEFPDLAQSGGSSEVFPANGVIPSEWEVPLSANSGWSVTTSRVTEGDFAIKANTIGANERAALVLERTFVGGQFSLEYFVSSESGYDYFEVIIDGTSVVRESGLSSDWQSFSTNIPSGFHSIELRYSKDGSVDENDDTVWVDNVVVPD